MKLKIFLLLSISMFFFSCNDEMFSKQEPDYLNSSLHPMTWQEQLNYAQNKNTINTKTLSEDRIYLRAYTYKGTIDTDKERSDIMEELFSDSSVTVKYTDNSNFEIVPLKTIRDNAKILGSKDPLLDLKAQLDTLIQIGMELIELEWNYKGNIFYSTAIASNDKGGIIYDHIGYLILETAETEHEIESLSLNTPLIKTGNESGGESIILRFTKPRSIPNSYGTIVISFNITCSSYFDSRGILYDRTLNATHSASTGFSCTADIRTVSGDIGSSRFHEFAWGYNYGSGITASLGWNGTGFTISGGGQGATGTEVHRP